MKKTVTIFFPNGTVTIYEEGKNCERFFIKNEVVLIVQTNKTLLELVNIPFFINDTF